MPTKHSLRVFFEHEMLYSVHRQSQFLGARRLFDAKLERQSMGKRYRCQLAKCAAGAMVWLLVEGVKSVINEVGHSLNQS